MSEKESKIKTWWKRTTLQTKLLSTLPLLVIVPFLVYGIKDGFPVVGWVIGGLITLGVLSGIIYANIKDYISNK